MSNVGIIGGADGPTAIFVTSALPRMLNPWGMAIILLIMIPNVIFALRPVSYTHLTLPTIA